MKINRFYVLVLVLVLVATACVQRTAAPSGAFVIEAESSVRMYLDNGSAFSQSLKKDGLDIYTNFITTGNIKNHMVEAAAGNYSEAQAFIVLSPAWIPTAMTGGTTIATSKMVIGVTAPEMSALGLVPGQIVPVGSLVEWINNKAMNPVVCNPTQCNDGFLFYSSVLMHFSGQTSLDINLTDGSEESKQILAQAQTLMKNLVISTSSSGDARAEMYKSISEGGSYNAWWSYEPEIADLNKQLVAEGKLPLYVVYVEGAIDAAQTLVLNPKYAKDEAVKAKFDKLVAFLIGTVKNNASQMAIGATGWRPSLYRVPVSMETLKPEWGFQADPMVSTSFAPRFDVAMPLNRTYVSVIRKPVIIFYFKDFSGSMDTNGGKKALLEASRYLFSDAASTDFLEATYGDVTQVFLFDHTCVPLPEVLDESPSGYKTLLGQIEGAALGGNTSMYACGVVGLRLMAEKYKDMCSTTHNCAFVFMTDGGDNDCDQTPCTSVMDFNQAKNDPGLGLAGVPVWVIPFGSNVNWDQLNSISGVKICKDTIIACFQKIKGSR